MEVHQGWHLAWGASCATRAEKQLCEHRCISQKNVLFSICSFGYNISHYETIICFLLLIPSLSKGTKLHTVLKLITLLILAVFHRKNYTMPLLSCLCFISCQLYSSCPHSYAVLLCLFSLSYCLMVRNQSHCITCMAFLGRRPNCCTRGTDSVNMSPGETIFPLNWLRNERKRQKYGTQLLQLWITTHFHLITVCMGKTSCYKYCVFSVI